jgi:hypothetical protein
VLPKSASGAAGFAVAMMSPQSVGELGATRFARGFLMTVTETMELTLLVTGSITFYILLQAAIDVVRRGVNRKD